MKWISVKDELPKDDSLQLGWDGNHVCICFLDETEWKCEEWMEKSISHWMPLPKPPKPECDCREMNRLGAPHVSIDVLFECDKCREK